MLAPVNLTAVAIVGVLAIVAVAAGAKRLGLASPLALVVVGIIVSLIPGIPDVPIEPEVILTGVLPPLLYSSAVNMPAQDFRRNLSQITFLAVVLVIATTGAAAALIHLMMPDIGWAVAFALGAVISPTDAVAATSIGKKLGLPPRLVVLLEGEGLVNDASALVLLRSAIAATSGSLAFVHVVGDFAYAVLVAVAIGVVAGVLAITVRSWVQDTVLSSATSLVTPFIAYLPAEELGASGVLAVVIAGLVCGTLSARRLSAIDRVSDATNWRTISFLLESAIFLLMGMSLAPLIDQVRAGADGALGDAAALALALTVLVVMIRFLFVVPLVAGIKREVHQSDKRRSRLDQVRDAWRDSPRSVASRRAKYIELRFIRSYADIEFNEREALGWRSGIALGWSGMRGAITLAAAQTLPEDIEHRSLLILVACLVAIATLLLEGLTLPAVIRRLRIPGPDLDELAAETRELLIGLNDAALSEIDVIEAEINDLDERAQPMPLQALTDIRARYAQRPERQGQGQADEDGATAADRRARYIEFALRLVSAQRNALLLERARGTHTTEAIQRTQAMLDTQEIQLTRGS